MFLGIDISKATLDAAFLPSQDATKARHKTFSNTPAGHQQLLDWLQNQLPNDPQNHAPARAHACLEATGSYGGAVARALYDAGHAVSVVNPAAVHALGKSQLKRLKTDKADALLIARFCVVARPALWSPPAPHHEQLQGLVRRLEALDEMKQMEENRLENTHEGDAVQASLLDHIAYLQGQIEATRRHIQDHIAAHPALREQAQLLSSIPGIGQTTAAALLAELGDLSQFQNARQVAAFAGLAPCVRESGSSVRGKPRLSKIGSPRLRKCLYFPAMAALRWNPLIQALGQRLSDKGKCKMLILGAAMRKLLHLAYGVLKSGKPFDANFNPQTSISCP